MSFVILVLISKSKIPIIPILPNKSQAQNPKRTNPVLIWDLEIIWDLVVFGFGI
jgi:hypothetical protein